MRYLSAKPAESSERADKSLLSAMKLIYLSEKTAQTTLLKRYIRAEASLCALEVQLYEARLRAGERGVQRHGLHGELAALV